MATRSNFIENILGQLLSAADSRHRWSIVKKTLQNLGATAVNSSKIENRDGTFRWFRSTLPNNVVENYLSEGHHQHDLIAKHAVECDDDLIWKPKEGWVGDKTNDRLGFADFVSDFGYLSVFSCAASEACDGTTLSLTYCSDQNPATVLSGARLNRLQTVSKLLLPWCRWDGDHTNSEFLPLERSLLSQRQRDVLSFLAHGCHLSQVADAMGISDAMVSKHIYNARRKLKAKTSIQAVTVAIRDGHIRL